MNSTLKKALVWIAKLALTAAIVAYILRTAPVHEIWEALQGARFFYMLPAIFALLVSRVLMGFRMKRVTDHQGMTLTIPQLVGISLTSTFYGTFLPGSLGGGLVRWYRLSRQDQKRSAALAAIGFDRLADMSATMGLGLVCWLASAQARQSPVIGMLFAGAWIACVLIYLGAFHAKGSVLFGRSC
jgi:glycosyltransferase 2 family protein